MLERHCVVPVLLKRGELKCLWAELCAAIAEVLEMLQGAFGFQRSRLVNKPINPHLSNAINECER